MGRGGVYMEDKKGTQGVYSTSEEIIVGAFENIDRTARMTCDSSGRGLWFMACQEGIQYTAHQEWVFGSQERSTCRAVIGLC